MHRRPHIPNRHPAQPPGRLLVRPVRRKRPDVRRTR